MGTGRAAEHGRLAPPVHILRAVAVLQVSVLQRLPSPRRTPGDRFLGQPRAGAGRSPGRGVRRRAEAPALAKLTIDVGRVIDPTFRLLGSPFRRTSHALTLAWRFFCASVVRIW